MPIPALIPALAKILGLLKGIIGGTPGMSLEFGSNNKMSKVLKQGGNAVAEHVHAVGIKFAGEIGIEQNLRLPFASELFNCIFSTFYSGQQWELIFVQQIQDAFTKMFNLFDKYKPMNYNPDAFLTYIIELGGDTQIHWWKGSGKTKIQGRLGPGKWADKLKTFFKDGYTPPAPPPPPPPPPGKDFTVQDVIRIFNNLFPEVTDSTISLFHSTEAFNHPAWKLSEINIIWTNHSNNVWKPIINGIKAITTIDDYNVLWNVSKSKNWDNQGTIDEYINLKKQGKGGNPIQAGFNPIMILLIAGIAFGMFKKSG